MLALRWFPIVAAVVALAGAAAFVTRGLVLSHQVASARQQAASDLRTNLAGARQQAVQDLDELLRVGKVGEPTQVWREVICEVDHQDAGWLVDHYYQSCSIHSVAALPTSQLGHRDYCQGEPLLGRFEFSSRALVANVRAERFDECSTRTLLLPFQIHSRLTRAMEGRPITKTELGESPNWRVAVVDTEISKTKLGC